MDIGFTIGPKNVTFDVALYFIAVTCATVGYGDYTP
jgi:hypothetical protein